MEEGGVMTTVVNRARTDKWDVYIGRPSKWGNLWSHKGSRIRDVQVVATVEEAIAKYENYIRSNPQLVADAKRELKGKILACWCKPGPCHGDVLARIAEEP
jgi:hypothetical protein